ncbi:uncharacterized protein LOC112631966 [Theropithecus gelada]|uniref:uncharacterized protein LOC112631966 n=1 Tax=Theropithecus gelada TaxID=9565 RepID=UPI000DC18A4A|nr:uncharacterized protein LOC112631966 [Theropithecus gelada]
MGKQFPRTAKADTGDGAPYLRLVPRSRPRAVDSACACGGQRTSAPRPRPEQPRAGHVTYSLTVAYPSTPSSSGSSPSSSRWPPWPCVRVVSADRSAHTGIGACSQKRYCVTPAHQLRFAVSAVGFFLSPQIHRDRILRAQFLGGHHFHPVNFQRHVKTVTSK